MAPGPEASLGLPRISPFSYAIESLLLPGEIAKTFPRSTLFSLRFFNSDRLQERRRRSFYLELRMSYWLMKSEPAEVNIDDLAAAPKKTVAWFGVRNYQARNFMRDQMKLGDKVFFYHSSCEEPGIAGLASVSKLAYRDATQFDPNSKYFDAKASKTNPRWFNVEVKFVKKTRLVGIQELRGYPELAQMRILQKGNRLSITPIEPREWDFIISKL